MFERTALPAGPRVISAGLPGARSVSIAAYVLAGSRLETPAEAGVAHFMEHITFKGTARFPSTRAISEAIEGVGGSFNAATDRESTVYWVRVPRREATRAMDVLGELIVRPTLDDAEIDGERTVIIEEIRSYLDDPAEYAQILFQQAMFGDGALGREICGDEEGIRALPADTIRSFWRTTYRPANTVVAIAGDISHDESVELTRAAFGTGNGVVPGYAPAPVLPAGGEWSMYAPYAPFWKPIQPAYTSPERLTETVPKISLMSSGASVVLSGPVKTFVAAQVAPSSLLTATQ